MKHLQKQPELFLNKKNTEIFVTGWKMYIGAKLEGAAGAGAPIVFLVS